MGEEAEQAEMVREEPVVKAVLVGEVEEATFMSTIFDIHQILVESQTLRTSLVV